MPLIKSIDELVDKAIEEAINKSDIDIFSKSDFSKPDIDLFSTSETKMFNKFDIDIEEIKKRKPKPFRYLNKEESEIELKKETENITMMRELKTQMFDNKIAILGLGDIEKIENVIRKHQASRKFK